MQCAANASSALAAAGGLTGASLWLSRVLGPRSRRVVLTLATVAAVVVLSVFVG